MSIYTCRIIYILKERGFVNGAIGQVESLLVHKPNLIVFTMLLSTGVRVLVHPITERGKTFLPCTFGYAMTTRKAQGATLDGAVLYMDMMFRPASPGYAYVGASRVKHHSQLFYYGTVRRSDWIPVGEP